MKKNSVIKSYNGRDGNIQVIPKNMEKKRDGRFYALFTRNVLHKNLKNLM